MGWTGRQRERWRERGRERAREREINNNCIIAML
jgi:hypothetical protein